MTKGIGKLAAATPTPVLSSVRREMSTVFFPLAGAPWLGPNALGNFPLPCAQEGSEQEKMLRRNEKVRSAWRCRQAISTSPSQPLST